MKSNILIIVTILIFFFSCEKQNIESNTLLIGKWQWQSSCGGIAGICYTPQSSGENQMIEFTSDSTFRKFVNGKLLQESKFHIAKNKSIYSLEATDIISYENSFPQSFNFIGSDKLILNDEVYDGFQDTFTRIK